MTALCALGSCAGLERIQALLAALDHPEQSLAYIHVAGTNGKGSTSMMIAAGLSRAGYRTARFSSPHLHSYRERFLIDGEPVPASQLYHLLQEVKACIPHLLQQGQQHPTEFEVLSAMAFLCFQRAAVDIAVLEVGMGGSYDSTNVITPLLSVITSIDYDHMSFLGTSLEEIAANKAGIIKPGVPVLIGGLPPAAQAVIARYAAELQAPLWEAKDIGIECLEQGLDGQRLRLTAGPLSSPKLHLGLNGDYQLANLALAVKALLLLREQGYRIRTENLAAAMAELSVPGRMEVISRQPLILLDAAHNPQGARAVRAALNSLLPGRSCVLLCGILDDKELADILEPLAENVRVAVITRPESSRSEHWQRVSAYGRARWPEKAWLEEENIELALAQARTLTQPDEYLLITGSFYLLGPARAIAMNSSIPVINETVIEGKKNP